MLFAASRKPRSIPFFIHRMGIEIQRDNAAKILETISPSDSLYGTPYGQLTQVSHIIYFLNKQDQT